MLEINFATWGKYSLGRTQKFLTKKEKPNKSDFIKMGNLCSLKSSVKQLVKKHGTNRKTHFSKEDI